VRRMTLTHFRLEVGVVGLVDDGHAALAELLEDVVATEGVTDEVCHTVTPKTISSDSLIFEAGPILCKGDGVRMKFLLLMDRLSLTANLEG
jgi:hypothetical protein